MLLIISLLYVGMLSGNKIGQQFCPLISSLSFCLRNVAFFMEKKPLIAQFIFMVSLNIAVLVHAFGRSLRSTIYLKHRRCESCASIHNLCVFSAGSFITPHKKTTLIWKKKLHF